MEPCEESIVNYLCLKEKQDSLSKAAAAERATQAQDVARHKRHKQSG